MKNTDSVPRQDDETQATDGLISEQVAKEQPKKKEKERSDKKKKKRNLWPLKAFAITLVLSAAVNASSTLALSDSQWWLALILTVLIMLIGVAFDIIGTAATSCDVQPFLSMASRKVKGAKLAVKLCKKSDVVSSVCCDIVGDVCGIVSGITAAAIVLDVASFESAVANFLISVLVYAVISTLTITLKATGKGVAVKQANKIIFGVARALSIFRKEG